MNFFADLIIGFVLGWLGAMESNLVLTGQKPADYLEA